MDRIYIDVAYAILRQLISGRDKSGLRTDYDLLSDYPETEVIRGTSAVVPDWCYLIPYCAELRDIDVTSHDGDPYLNLPLPISTNTTDCFFLTNVSKRVQRSLL